MDVKGDEENSHSRSGTPLFGAIFMSNRRTKQECFERSLFGLPSSQAHFVNKIKCGMVLFLFEYEERKLYGVFRANSDGAMNIKPNAFKSSGKQFPAQVSFRSQWKCHPVSESEFRDAVKDNYYTKEKFGFGLSEDQVHKLLLLFSTRIKDSSVPSKSLTTSTEVMRKRGKSGLGTVSVSGNGRRVVTTDRAGTKQGRDNAPVRMNSTGYRTSPSRISYRLGSSEKDFSRRDDRDNKLITPHNSSYISEHPRYVHGNSPDSFYLDRRSQIPAAHLEPVCSIAPDSSYAGYRSQPIPTTHQEPESSVLPTIQFRNPNAMIDNPPDYIPLGSDVRIQECGYHGNQDSASNNFEMYPDHIQHSVPRVPGLRNEINERENTFSSSFGLASGTGADHTMILEHSVPRVPGLRNEINERENTFSSSFGLASGTGPSPAHHLDCIGGGLRYWQMDTSAALSLEMNENPVPQLDYYSREAQKLDPGVSLVYDYPTEDIKDYRNHVSLRADTQKTRRSVFSRLNKVKGNITENQHGKGNTGSDMAVEQLMGELHYQNRSRKEMRNSGQSIARDDTSRNLKMHIALDDDKRNSKWHAARDENNRNSKWHPARDDDHRNSKWHTARDDDHRNSKRRANDLDCSKKNSRGSVDHNNDDFGDSKRNLGRFAVVDDDRDTNKGILRRSSSHDDEHDTSKGKSRQFTAGVDVRDDIKKNPNRLTAPDNDHGSNKRNSGRSIARDEGHAKKAKIEDDNNLACEEEKLMETDGEEAPLVNYKRRSETGKGSGLRGCVKGFDSEVVPGKKRKLVRPSFGSVAGGEGIGCRQDELPQDFGRKSEGNSDREPIGSTRNDIEVGLSREVVATDCLLESKLDHIVRGNHADHRECSHLSEQVVGDIFVKTASEGKTVDLSLKCISANDDMKVGRECGEAVAKECLKCISANDDMKVEGECREAVSKECLLTVHTPSQVAVVCAGGRKETDEDSSHEALQNPVVGSIKTEIKGSPKACSFESSGVECYKEEDLAQKLGSRGCCLNMEGVTKDVVFSAVGLKETVEKNAITAVQEHGPSESESKSNMLNGIPTINAVEDLKEGKSQVYVASDHKPEAQWSSQYGVDHVVSTEGLKQTTMEVPSKAQPKLIDGSFEPQGKGTEVDLAIEQHTGESHKEKAPSEGLIAENLLLNRQGLSQDTMVCGVSLQQTTKRGLNIAVEEFSGGSFESECKGEKVKVYLKGTDETLHKEKQSQEPDARDSLQQLAEEPPFCIEADKVNSEKTDAVTDGSLTCDGRESSVELKSSKPEFPSGKTDGQTLHHIIPLSGFKDETTAKMVGEDDGCERECKPDVSSATMQSESEQRPLRRVKKVLKRVKKGTSNPSA